ncbi:hypothetical protein FPQ18DRAFT_341808 [Pyronema domesticum]|uniref:Similar to NADH dehydrogenase [ubiquinone] 1 alpha subcomplex assembly factor 3 acc. no. Q9JKL4 n=1 Tax=Pyronema omphalodes (strain CBS 100304) TaxID=1076935 RepID=U4LF27_PYROM|nr:hypothetical protein FPQ18DRAFT_341808 [Pyronema domesticum]CCX30724.1 Similar to NADH dehydrogenase [ubiquinone] 1 alpha subcomplex assembly factor 3; acc. no. Q9JKL4 [Pyronema omphalodes CBS 100304]
MLPLTRGLLRALPRATPLRIAPALTRAFHLTPPITRQVSVAASTEEMQAAKESRVTDPDIPTLDIISNLNVYSDIPAPASAIDTIYDDGFTFTSGLTFTDGSGCILIHNEAFKWRPTVKGDEIEAKAMKTGILELGKEVWGLLDVVTPKPELLIVGTGKRTLMLSKEDRERITELGIRMDVMDTTHAAAQYNLLATERPNGQVAAALLVDAFAEVKKKKGGFGKD